MDRVGKPMRARLAFYATNALAVVLIIALCYFFLILGNSLLSGLGKDVVHYDAQGRPYVTKMNGVSEGAWLAFLAWYLFIFAKVLLVSFVLNLFGKWFPGVRESLCLKKSVRHRFHDLVDVHTSGADVGAGLIAAVSFLALAAYAVANYLLRHGGAVYAGARFSMVVWVLNSAELMAMAAFLLSFFTLGKSAKSIVAFLIALGAAVYTHNYAIARTYQWLAAGLPSFDPMPAYIAACALLALVSFLIVTLGKKRSLLVPACALLTALLYAYYKLQYGFGVLELDVAYLTGALAGPVTLIHLTVQLNGRLDMRA